MISHDFPRFCGPSAVVSLPPSPGGHGQIRWAIRKGRPATNGRRLASLFGGDVCRFDFPNAHSALFVCRQRPRCKRQPTPCRPAIAPDLRSTTAHRRPLRTHAHRPVQVHAPPRRLPCEGSVLPLRCTNADVATGRCGLRCHWRCNADMGCSCVPHRTPFDEGPGARLGGGFPKRRRVPECSGPVRSWTPVRRVGKGVGRLGLAGRLRCPLPPLARPRASGVGLRGARPTHRCVARPFICVPCPDHFVVVHRDAVSLPLQERPRGLLLCGPRA